MSVCLFLGAVFLAIPFTIGTTIFLTSAVVALYKILAMFAVFAFVGWLQRGGQRVRPEAPKRRVAEEVGEAVGPGGLAHGL